MDNDHGFSSIPLFMDNFHLCTPSSMTKPCHCYFLQKSVQVDICVHGQFPCLNTNFHDRYLLVIILHGKCPCSITMSMKFQCCPCQMSMFNNNVHGILMLPMDLLKLFASETKQLILKSTLVVLQWEMKNMFFYYSSFYIVLIYFFASSSQRTNLKLQQKRLPLTAAYAI